MDDQRVDRKGGSVIVIRIHGWRSGEAWLEFAPYVRRSLIGRLREYSDLKQPDIESVADEVRNKTCKEIPLAKAKDRYEAHSVRSLLDSLGADTTVEEI